MLTSLSMLSLYGETLFAVWSTAVLTYAASKKGQGRGLNR